MKNRTFSPRSCPERNQQHASRVRSQRDAAIVFVGGDARQPGAHYEGANVRSFASSKHGNGNTRQALATIRGGTVDLVVLLVRWLGHPESQAVARTCRALGVHCVTVVGGMSAAARVVRRFLGQEVRDDR